MVTSRLLVGRDEELPEVVERLRRQETEGVDLILPAGSRLASSRFNLQLLDQCALHTGKCLRLVSDDPATCRMAAEAGLLVLAPPAEATPHVRVSPLPPWVESEATEPPPLRSRLRAWRQRAPADAMAALEVKLDSRPGRLAVKSLGVLALVATLLALSLVVPSARVTLVVPASAFTGKEIELTAQPGISSPVHVRSAASSQQLSGRFTSTALKVSRASRAVGTAVYSNRCPFSADVPGGTRLLTPGGVEFQQVDNVTVPRRQTATGAITAVAAGAEGNVDAGQITSLNLGSGFDLVTLLGCVTVSNPDPTSGGADRRREVQVSEADLQTARAQLEAQLRRQLGAALAQQAGAGEKLSPEIAFDVVDFTAERRPGETASDFGAAMTIKGEGTFYAVADLDRVLAAHLRGEVGAGKTVDERSIRTVHRIVSSDRNGQIRFAGRAMGYVSPRLDVGQIRSHLAGKPVGQAREYLKSLPIKSAQVQQDPLELPVLPFLGSRIQLRYVASSSPIA